MKLHTFKPRAWSLLNEHRPKSAFLNDVAAGGAVGLIALPLALALGIASVPQGVDTPYPAPALGLFTAIIAGFLISLLGGSRVQIGGPTAAFIPIVLLIVEAHGYAGLILATMMAGVILIVMGFARLGTLIKFIPWPVTTGFTTGIAIAIISTQVADFTGLQAETGAPREFLEKCLWIFEHLGSVDALTLVFGLASCAMIFLWPRFGWRFLPGSIVAMVVATVVSILLQRFGGLEVATIGSRFGADAIPHQLPSFALPEISFDLIRELIAPATAIAILCAIESLLSAVVADGLSGDRHDSNTELIAQGVANLVCPFFGGLPATGAIARTSANISNGGSSPISGMVHAAVLLLVVLIFASFASYIPMSTMAAVLVMVALRMGEWHELKRIQQMPASDALVLLTTLLLTVIFDLVVAVEVGMVLAALLFIRRISETTEVGRVTENDVLESPEQIAQGKTIPDGVLVYRIFGPFLFGAAEKMQDVLEDMPSFPKVLILRMHLVSAMDMTAEHALASVVERMQKHGSYVIISGIHHQPLALLKKSGMIRRIGMANFCGHFDEALIRAQDLLETQE